MKFEFARGDCVLTDCHCVRRVVSFDAVAEVVLPCKTTEGVVERRVKHDAEVVHVSR